jgi:hypothetical protein
VGRPVLRASRPISQRLRVAGWSPQPGTIDDVEWTVWDIYKMVAGSELPTAEAAYVVAFGNAATVERHP